MTHTPLIQPTELLALLNGPAPRPAVLDCSFDLSNPAAGRALHDTGHLPGALYLHLDDDLSAPKTGRNGRHPLPTREAFAARLAALGVNDDSAVVLYDASGGMYAARAWWMLRWAGHANVAVLDGGLAAWKAAGGPLPSTPTPAPARGNFTLRPTLVASVDREALLRNLQTKAHLVIDARAPDRFRGENETLDPVGGHIPGAANRFFRNNLQPDGRFKPPAQLLADWQAVAGGRPASDLVQQCGSGVTACHNLLALAAAGLDGAALYAGSWSEWCSRDNAPMALGG